MNFTPLLQRLQIAAFCTAAAVLYGIIHDQITARICVEYFTEGHPRIIASTSPTALGFAWGFVATWWVGFILGTLLAAVSHASASSPPTSFAEIRRSIFTLLGVMAAGAALSGVIGYWLTADGRFSLPLPWSMSLSAEHQARFAGVWWAHSASYLFGLGGGVVLIVRVWVHRGRPVIIRLVPSDRAGLWRVVALFVILGYVVWSRFYR
jgi:hypothetical protein